MTEISTQVNVRNHERTIQPSLLKCIATILEEIVEETDKLDSSSTSFHASKIPAITLENYLIRIAKYAKCTDECFVIALIYLDKVQELNPSILLNSHCVHRFLIIAIVLAIKFQDDDYYRNDYYSKIAGISLKELNQLESELLELLNYDLFISKELYNIYLEKLRQYQEQ
ncbi:unnamed protein product [Paramecium octaurelia]|uniref:Cyclin n=1 Tax=Paramecium octaurelia TaxID=43137 RepID=A0A8S1WS51_PAROT|nr:unnamed protein product [Paramecium octaurelia]